MNDISMNQKSCINNKIIPFFEHIIVGLLFILYAILVYIYDIGPAYPLAIIMALWGLLNLQIGIKIYYYYFKFKKYENDEIIEQEKIKIKIKENIKKGQYKSAISRYVYLIRKYKNEQEKYIKALANLYLKIGNEKIAGSLLLLHENRNEAQENAVHIFCKSIGYSSFYMLKVIYKYRSKETLLAHKKYLQKLMNNVSQQEKKSFIVQYFEYIFIQPSWWKKILEYKDFIINIIVLIFFYTCLILLV